MTFKKTIEGVIKIEPGQVGQVLSTALNAETGKIVWNWRYKTEEEKKIDEEIEKRKGWYD